MEERDSDLVAVGEAARLLGVSPARVRQLEREGRLSSRRISGWRAFARSDVEELAVERARQIAAVHRP